MVKDRILDLLGERQILLPELIDAGLAANDRAKVLLSILQAACWHADHADRPLPELTAERHAVGLDEAWLDELVREARAVPGGYALPQGKRLVEALLAAVEAMARPLGLAGPAAAGEAADAGRRLGLLRDRLTVDGDTLARATVERLTRLGEGGEDSLHRLVADLHKGLNRLQRSIARDVVDGAAAYGLAAEDVPLLRAFMRGVNATARLKFDHPGLGTTATRRAEAGGADVVRGGLVIQNDIGTTDAHVVVVHVAAAGGRWTAGVTYTDIHPERLAFFRGMLDGFELAWETTTHPLEGFESDSFQMITGRLTADHPAELEPFLTHLGSRLVFLIDWNRARKRLRRLVSRNAALGLLRWAAANNYGHRAFLALGGERLVFDAITGAVNPPPRFGATFDELLGAGPAVDYLRFVLRTAAEGLLAGRSAALIKDEVKAELVTRFNSAAEQVLAVMADHAACVAEGAMAVRDVLLQGGEAAAAGLAGRTARRAKIWESRADRMVMEARGLLRRAVTSSGALGRLLEEADDAMDDVEETAFLLTLLWDCGGEAAAGSQEALAAALVAASQEWVKAMESARHVRRGGMRDDLQDLLEAVDRVVGLEHQADIAERAAKAELLTAAADFRQLHVLDEIAGRLEHATDALSRSAMVLREYVMGDVISA